MRPTRRAAFVIRRVKTGPDGGLRRGLPTAGSYSGPLSPGQALAAAALAAFGGRPTSRRPSAWPHVALRHVQRQPTGDGRRAAAVDGICTESPLTTQKRSTMAPWTPSTSHRSLRTAGPHCRVRRQGAVAGDGSRAENYRDYKRTDFGTAGLSPAGESAAASSLRPGSTSSGW